MPEPTDVLGSHLAEERSRAVRLLLGRPLVDAPADPEGFRLATRHRAFLADWFERTCGWTVHVDVAAGYARLVKRSPEVDVSRPLHRTRGAGAPFDRRRYELLCRVCAELVRHPVTTVGLLAAAVTPAAGLDSARRAERSAFVDALRALQTWGALRATGGDVDTFVDDAGGNAILTADTARLHHLLASATAPSTLADDLDPPAAVAALLAEPRYGDAPADLSAADEESRLRWVRHRLARRLLDDPVVHLDELDPAERDYLEHPSGRRWLRERVAEAGFVLEERAEGLLAVDPDAIATDLVFPAPAGNAYQLALLLIDRLLAAAPADGDDGPHWRGGSLSAVELRAEVDGVLRRFPGWARSARDGDGPDQLADDAVALLAAFGLVARGPDGTVTARPALARYRVAEPVARVPAAGGGEPQVSLFEDSP